MSILSKDFQRKPPSQDTNASRAGRTVDGSCACGLWKLWTTVSPAREPERPHSVDLPAKSIVSGSCRAEGPLAPDFTWLSHPSAVCTTEKISSAANGSASMNAPDAGVDLSKPAVSASCQNGQDALAEAIRRQEAELAAIMQAFDCQHQERLEEEQAAELDAPCLLLGRNPDRLAALRGCLRTRLCDFRVRFASSSTAVHADGQVQEVPIFNLQTASTEQGGESSGHALRPRGVVEFKVKSIKDLGAWLDDRSRLLQTSSVGDRKSRRREDRHLSGIDEVDIALAHALENAVFNVKDVL